ncbi:polysaccharide pyruvyl transferase family protein [Methanobacterium aggregans]|uniref:polysaccharide pyruvyl transferase family protein n=1 Tax=Methanobacterium aggregans TaxID=1615586 RepID=UPI001AE7546F|nr:polysaccharide pyruvyl transferase family protein [Methanobacterium aggregans]MBP2047059.1 polysaccharide pyruvyl transferase WcaK-like protein [Methanobacterium aggregans]
MVKDDPTIGLYGIWGVYNYGCEAIVRGTEIIIHEVWPNAHIKYISPRPEDDKNRLKGCNVEVVPRKFHNLLSISRLNGIMGQITGFYSKKFYQEDLKWIEDCDIIFSIGGDIYTLPQNYNPKKKYYHPLIHFGDFVKSRGKIFVIWGASIGPFEGYPKAKKAFIDHLNRIDLITSREPVTTRYLTDLGMKNFTEYPDPAFRVPKLDSINKKTSDKLNIGINLSPLSSSYSFKSDMDVVIKAQADLITELIKEFDAQITLIPHVVCDFDVNDDDLRYLKLIKSQISEDVVDNITLVEDDSGFIGTKEILYSCDVVIAARMHCAINAISIGVPTIFFAYSKKTYGMAEYVYGNHKWVVPLKDLKNRDIKGLIKKILEEKELFNLNNEIKNNYDLIRSL